MNLIFTDCSISLDDIYDYATAEYIDDVKEMFSDEEITDIHIPFSSEGINDIVEYLHSIDLWNKIIERKSNTITTCSTQDSSTVIDIPSKGDTYDTGIVQNHIDIVKYLGLKPLYWMLNESQKDNYEVETDPYTVTIKDENCRECISRTFKGMISRWFKHNSYIYIYGFYKDETYALKAFNHRLEEVTNTDVKDVTFPKIIRINDYFPFESEEAFIYKYLIIDPHYSIYNLITGKRLNIGYAENNVIDHKSYISNSILYISYTIVDIGDDSDDEDNEYSEDYLYEIHEDKILMSITSPVTWRNKMVEFDINTFEPKEQDIIS